MARFDRYMLAQLLMLFGFFSLVLVMVYWVNRAVVLFDQLIANGHSAGVFLEFTVLSLPNVIRIVMPVSAFAAAVYVTNRLSSESELVVVQATGYSPARLARPVLIFGVAVALMVSALTHVLVPASLTTLKDRTAEISENVTARLLSDGVFLQPSDDVTFYIREITPQGELRDIFLSDNRIETQRVTYTASRALLLRSDVGPRLMMFDGMVQTLRHDTGQLAVTRFDEFGFDIAALIALPTAGPRTMNELGTLELLAAQPDVQAETGKTRARLIHEGHERFTQALLAMVTPLVGFSILLLGGFSRFGIWRQIVGAVLCLIIIELLDNALADAARSTAALWPLAYVPVVFGLSLCGLFLWLAARPALFRRRGPPGPQAVP